MRDTMQTYVAARPSRRPTHPGEILREEVLPALHMGISETAKALGVSRQMLHRVLAEEASVTPEMALRLGKFCGNGPEVWLNMQVKRDLWDAKEAMAEQIAAIKTRAAVICHGELVPVAETDFEL